MLDALAALPLPLVLLVAAVAAFAESGLGVGILVPGETVVLVLSASVRSPASVAALFAAVTLGVVAGDHVGYALGRRYGERLRGTRLVGRLGVRHWDRATDALRRHGAAAVVLTRPLPVVRTFAPAAAGTAGLAYRRFLPASLAGAAAWSAVYVTGGAAAGASLRSLQLSDRALAGLVAGTFAGVLVVALAARRLRAG